MRRAALLLLVASCAAVPREIVVDGRRRAAGLPVVLWTDPGGYDGYAEPHFGERTGRVRQIVLHYDAAGSARRCFEVLQARKLSCHFLVDTDGTVYQTLDVKERAWHAAEANDRSVGIEIAHLGAYPERMEGGVSGRIHGQVLWQRPFTDAQYASVGKLVGTLCRTLDIPVRAPPARGVVPDALAYEGILGHYHLTTRKVDPGPAFDWERLFRHTVPGE